MDADRTRKYNNSLGDEDIPFIINSLSPISKDEALKMIGSTADMTLVKKQFLDTLSINLFLQNVSNNLTSKIKLPLKSN